MPDALTLAAFVAAALSATALYAGSEHCRWAALRGFGRYGTAAGVALSVPALALWCVGYGIGAGLCLALLSWMTVAVALPYLALWTSTRAGRQQ